MEINTEEYRLIDLNPENIDNEHICCAIGNDAVNSRRAEEKKDWLRDRFRQGHRFKKADLRGKVFIEYCPAEIALSPIKADGYMFIQCFWVSGRYKGHGFGRRLYEACEAECRAEGFKGMVAVSSAKKKPFMVDKKFLSHFGFTAMDSAQPYFELLVKKFDPSAPDPRFMDSARRGSLEGKKGLTFFYAPLCPFNKDFTEIMANVGKEMGIPSEIHRIESRDQLETLPIPWGIFSVFYDGRFIAHEIMTENRFRKVLEKAIAKPD